MFKTDKVINGYLPTYLGILAQLPSFAVICELGVDNGYSLEMWQTLMPSATVIGVDNRLNAVWPKGTVKVISLQDNRSLPDILRQRNGIHLIVDDASHEAEATNDSFNLLWPLLAPGGFYVIEDWGVGFPSWRLADDGMLVFAQALLNLLDPAPNGLRDDVDSITYRRGMIILRKM